MDVTTDRGWDHPAEILPAAQQLLGEADSPATGSPSRYPRLGRDSKPSLISMTPDGAAEINAADEEEVAEAEEADDAEEAEDEEEEEEGSPPDTGVFEELREDFPAERFFDPFGVVGTSFATALAVGLAAFRQAR